MKILLRHGKKEDWKMVESAAYQNEAELQRLLAESPSLIGIDDVRPGAGTLITAVRELPLSIGYVDLVAFSAQGDVAIMECKLADNSEIKRKVIGQAFEYGAHIWNMEYAELDQKIQVRTGKNLVDLVRERITDLEWDEESFRLNIENALKTGSFILMIVVDQINDDLARIIHFVNACGNPTFSFAALEMRRFQSGDAEMLVPRITGDNRPQIATSPSSARKRWTKEAFFEDARSRLDTRTLQLVINLYEWSGKHADMVRMGTGSADGSFTFLYQRNGELSSVFSVFSNGTLSINFGYMEKIFTPTEIATFRYDLASIPPLEAIRDSPKYFYNIPLLDTFSAPEHLQAFKEKVLALKKLLV